MRVEWPGAMPGLALDASFTSNPKKNKTPTDVNQRWLPAIDFV
jgi:hypothetical protein